MTTEAVPSDLELTPVNDLPADEDLTPVEAAAAPTIDELAPADPAAAAENTANEARIKFARQIAATQTPEAGLKNYVVARDLGLPLQNVEADPKGWYAEHAQQQNEPKVWAADHQILAGMVDKHPALAPLIVTDQGLGLLMEAFNAATRVGDYFKPTISRAAEAEFRAPGTITGPVSAFILRDLAGPNGEEKRIADLARLNELKATGLDEDAAVKALEEENTYKQLQAADKREAPKQVSQLDDGEARAIRGSSTEPTAFILKRRFEEGQAGIAATRATFELMNALDARDRGEESDVEGALTRRRALKEAAIPKAYGETGLTKLLGETLNATASSYEMAKDGLVAGGIGAAVGGAGGAIVGGVVGKTPAAAVAGARVGARLVGKQAGRAGAFLSAYTLEAASFYEETEGAKTDDKKEIPERTRRGTAKVVGAISAVIEVIELEQQLSNFNSLKSLFHGDPRTVIKKLVLSDAGFREIMGRYASSSAKEIAEEGVQNMVHDIGAYLDRSATAGKLANGPVVSVRGAVQAMSDAVGSVALIGGVGAASSLITASRTAGASRAAENQPQAILNLGEHPTVQAAPEEFAKAIEETTAKSGEAVTALHVNAEAVKRYFQKHTEEERAKEATEVLGPTGPDKVAEAIATGAPIEVPMAQVLAKYSASPMAKALAADTTTQAYHLTPRELANGGAERLEAEAKAIAAPKLAETQRQQSLAVETKRRAAELRAADPKLSKSQAAAAAATDMAKYATLAARQGTSIEEQIAKHPLAYAMGDELPIGEEAPMPPRPPPTSGAELDAYLANTKPEQRAADLLRDDVSGLRNGRAHEDSGHAGPVTILTTPDGIKALNDHEQGGHDKANQLLSRMAAALKAVDSDTAQAGPNFIIPNAKQAEALAAVRAVLPADMQAHAQTAPSVAAASKLLETHVDEGRAASTIPARGATNADLSNLGATDLSAPKTSTPITAEEQARVDAMTPEERRRDTYFDESEATGAPGMLSGVGFRRTAPRANVLAIDLRFIRDLNLKFGKPFVNGLMKAFAETAMAIGGAHVYFAHLSGDEYAAKSDNPLELKAFRAALEAALREVKIPATVNGKFVTSLTPTFRHGIGEKTYGAADQALNAAKRSEAAAKAEHDDAGVRAVPRGEPGREGGVGGAGSVAGLATLPAQAAEDGSGTASDGRQDGQAADGNAGEVSDTSFDFGANVEEGPRKSRSEHTPEAMVAARASLEKMRSPPRIAMAKAYLDYVDGYEAGAERPTGDLVLLREFELSMLAEYGIADPAQGPTLTMTPKTTKGRNSRKTSGSGDTDALKAGRATKLGIDPRGIAEFSKKKYQPRDTPEGFHSPSVFGKEGTPEYAVAEDMLQELGALPAEELTNEAIQEAWLTKFGTRERAFADLFSTSARNDNLRKHWRASESEANRSADNASGVEVNQSLLDNSENNTGPEDLTIATEPSLWAHGPMRTGGAYWKQIEKAVRLAVEKNDRTLLYQIDPAAAAGFHAASAFGTPGTAEFQVAQDVLEELGGKPAGEVTVNQLWAAWQKAVAALPWNERGAAHEGNNAASRSNMEKHDRASVTPANASGLSAEDAPRMEMADGSLVEDLGATYEPSTFAPNDINSVYWKQIEKAVRLALTGDMTLLYALDQDSPTNTPRGYYQAPTPLERTHQAFFNKSATVATVVHEGGHAWLDIQGDAAESPDATQAQKDYYADLLKALGIEKRSDITTEVHERFARMNEAYMREGKAPTPELAKIFTRFKLWLTSIYKNVASLNVVMTDEIRRVFDRMLSVEADIDTAVERHGPAMVADAKAAGLTNEQWLNQRMAERDIIDMGTQRAQSAALEDIHRETERWWNDGLKELKPGLEETYEALPARVAQQILIEQRIVLPKARVEAAIGKRRIEGLKTAAKGETTNPDEVAMLAGFPTGEAMLKALGELKPKERWVAEQADAKMREAHPETYDDKKRMGIIIETGLRPYTQKRLLEEDAELRKRIGDKSQPNVEAMKRAAKMIVDARLLSNLNASAALATERSLAQAKARAFAKGEWEKAREAGRQQMLNMYLHRELLDAREERTKYNELVSRLGKKPAQERLGKASAEYQDAVNYVLEALGERESPDGRTLELPDIGEWVEPVKAALDKGVDGLAMADMRLIRDGLEWTDDAARDVTTALVERKRFEKEQVVADLIREGEANKKRIHKDLPVSGGAATLGDKLKSIPAELRGYILKDEMIAAWLGGMIAGKDWTESTWFKGLVQPLQEAEVRLSDLMKEVIEPIGKVFKGMSNEVRNGLSEAIDGAALLPDHGVESGQKIRADGWTRWHLVMMALNFGNTSNAHRLLVGRNITQVQMLKALSLMRKEEIDLVNAVWSAHEKLKPLAFDLEFKKTGVRPVGFDNTPTQLPNGVLTGGYVPAVYDRRFVSSRNDNVTTVEDLENVNTNNPTTNRSHLKARAKDYSAAINLDPNGLITQLHRSAHDIAFREPVQSAVGLLFDEKVQTMVKERMGDSAAASLKGWIAAVASPGALQGADNLTAAAQVYRTLKGNITFNALSYSVPNFIEDTTNLGLAMVNFDVGPGYLAGAVLEFARSPAQTWQGIEAKSPAIRAANDARMRDITRQIQAITPTMIEQAVDKVPGIGALARSAAVRFVDNAIEEHAFDLMEWSFKGTAIPVWMARYKQAIVEGETDARAVTLADDVIRRIFPRHSALAGASINRNQTIAMVLMFDGFIGGVRNTLATRVQRVIEEPGAGAKALSAASIAGILMTVGPISAFLKSRGPDDDDDSWSAWFSRAVLEGGTQTVVPGIGGEAAKWIEAKAKGKQFTPSPNLALSTMINLAKAVGQLFAGDVDGLKLAEALYRALGVFTKKPVSQPIRTGKGIIKFFEDGIQGPAEVPGGLFYGDNPKNAASPFNLGPIREKPLFPQ